MLQPVTPGGKFTEEVTPWAGQFVKDADKDIMVTLKKMGRLFKRETITHTYPFCVITSYSIHYTKLYEVKKKNARYARNPKSGEKVFVEEHYVPVFKFSKDFKTIVDKGLKQKGEA